ncbi:hypothetical protein UB45_18480 [Terrabacter sp. 28]|nr:hypothetical protein UB45_18480 [Terrabacter sp. 28]
MLACQPVTGATGGSGIIAALSGSTRSAGRHPSTRMCRLFVRATHALSWVLKSAGEANVRPGRNERSRWSWNRSTMPLASGSAGLQITTFAPSTPRKA